MSAECENFQKEDILEPGEHDVMFGRGGGTNNHVGNIKFRQLCFEHKFRYLAASKVDKPKVAREVVAIWRQQSPPGRFLTKAARDKSKGQESTWYDVGDQKAREKASQCLRERTPDVMPFIQQMKKQASGPTPPNPIPDYTASNDSKQNTDDIPVGQFDAASVAVALLNKQVDGTENPLLNEYLKKIAEAPAEDDMSIDENASVAAIAKALFKNSRVEDDNMSLVDFLQSDNTLDGDLDSVFTDTMSKFSWTKGLDMGNEMMSQHSLGRIGAKNNPDMFPDYVRSSNNRNSNMKYAKSNASTMSMLSEMTDILEDGGHTRSIASMSRAAKMKKGKEESNISMLSELTDMTGGFSNLGV